MLFCEVMLTSGLEPKSFPSTATCRMEQMEVTEDLAAPPPRQRTLAEFLQDAFANAAASTAPGHIPTHPSMVSAEAKELFYGIPAQPPAET